MAVDIERREMINLKHNDKVVINGKKGIVGTVGGYAVENGYEPFESIELAKERQHLLWWVNQEPTVLCNDKGYYERERGKWQNAIQIEDGQLVWLDGDVLIVKYMGDYSDMVHFERRK